LKNLVLFDIDGTLLRSGPAPMACLAAAFLKVTGRDYPLSVSPAGKTDPLIVREAFRAVGVPKRDWVELEQRILRKYPLYLERADQELRAASQLLEGVEGLLSFLTSRGCPMGLLTGNLEITARRKLEVFGLNRYFPVGGFGSDCADRNRLGRVALERASRHYQARFQPEKVWVVGDTPRDVEAARSLGARALAVATGPFTQPYLEEFLPDVSLPHLGQMGSVVEALSRR
jgi:phosphoglycolate phosphatase-like HAD superfamily hydrolase